MKKEQLKDAIHEVLIEFFDAHQSFLPESELMDVKQAALLLKLKRAMVYEKTSMKTLPHYKKAKKIMVKRSELLAWMEWAKWTLSRMFGIVPCNTCNLKKRDDK